ncbi:hypothetical protein BCR44DRAFT_1439513 [Catenaria anguillulae PL171]|uniref:Uncharacterized protein n=1 Tax=Catenaria anguillulae PL171 TaxID=765915 RepID=A0A1Y2HFF6_9FUNG|nr:hypothetical protein BCR44DRAFT_1439513 [Catenaria anguillulae PL171]
MARSSSGSVPPSTSARPAGLHVPRPVSTAASQPESVINLDRVIADPNVTIPGGIRAFLRSTQNPDLELVFGDEGEMVHLSPEAHIDAILRRSGLPALDADDGGSESSTDGEVMAMSSDESDSDLAGQAASSASAAAGIGSSTSAAATVAGSPDVWSIAQPPPPLNRTNANNRTLVAHSAASRNPSGAPGASLDGILVQAAAYGHAHHAATDRMSAVQSAASPNTSGRLAPFSALPSTLQSQPTRSVAVTQAMGGGFADTEQARLFTSSSPFMSSSPSLGQGHVRPTGTQAHSLPAPFMPASSASASIPFPAVPPMYQIQQQSDILHQPLQHLPPPLPLHPTLLSAAQQPRSRNAARTSEVAGLDSLDDLASEFDRVNKSVRR